jgi:hypothetical protein
MDDERGSLQLLVDMLFPERGVVVDTIDVALRAEILDVPEDALGVIGVLPPGRYTRQRLCDQLNSALVAHGLTRTIATVD